MWCKRGTIGPAQEREVNPMPIKIKLEREAANGIQTRYIMLRADEAATALKRGRMKWGSGPAWTVTAAQ